MANKSMKVGGGGRFQKLSTSIQKKEGVSKKQADAIAASIGRKKYGAERMAKMSASGRKKAKK